MTQQVDLNDFWVWIPMLLIIGVVSLVGLYKMFVSDWCSNA